MTPLPYTPAPTHRNTQQSLNSQQFAYRASANAAAAAAAAANGGGPNHCTCLTPGPTVPPAAPVLPSRQQSVPSRATQQQRTSAPRSSAGHDAQQQQLAAPYSYTLTVRAG